MAQIDDREIREALEAAVDQEPGSWLVGITLVLRDSEQVDGTVTLLEDDEVVVDTGEGQRRVRIEEIENMLMHFQSQGPE
jgi:hypothetical protein